jgi:hypothetical protein
MSDDEDTVVDVRSAAEREAGIERMRRWLNNLPPDLAKFYEDLRRLDPKGKPREK